MRIVLARPRTSRPEKLGRAGLLRRAAGEERHALSATVGSLQAGRLAMDGYMIKQYPAKEQAELRVRIKVPGSWHGFNNLSSAEKQEMYDAEAVDWVEAHRFSKTRFTKEETCAAIKFVCEAGVDQRVRCVRHESVSLQRGSHQLRGAVRSRELGSGRAVC